MKYIDKVYKFITKEKREIIGNLKAFNREGNFYLIDWVEVFNKNSDNFYINDLFITMKIIPFIMKQIIFIINILIIAFFLLKK